MTSDRGTGRPRLLVAIIRDRQPGPKVDAELAVFVERGLAPGWTPSCVRVQPPSSPQSPDRYPPIFALYRGVPAERIETELP